MNQEEELSRGIRAQELLDNPLLIEAFEAVEDDILRQMDEVNQRDVDMHTRLILAKQILHHLRRHIKSHITTGKMARTMLSRSIKL